MSRRRLFAWRELYTLGPWLLDRDGVTVASVSKFRTDVTTCASPWLVTLIGLPGFDRHTYGGHHASLELGKAAALTAWEAQGAGAEPAPYVEGPAAAVEPVRLADGLVDQVLLPGVEPVRLAARDLDAERQRREGRRGHAGPPAGGLFDHVARAQVELF